MTNREDQGTRHEAPGAKRERNLRNSSLSPSAFRLSPGFTLLEVMIALAIVAIALVTLLALGNRSIGIHARLQRMTQATLLAQRQMTAVEIRERASKSEPQAEEGTFEPPFEGYRWRTAYEETPVPSVRMVTVTVAWGDEARNERVDLNSFIFR